MDRAIIMFSKIGLMVMEGKMTDRDGGNKNYQQKSDQLFKGMVVITAHLFCLSVNGNPSLTFFHRFGSNYSSENLERAKFKRKP